MNMATTLNQSNFQEEIKKLEHVTPPKVWLRKMKTLFRCLDVDSNGYLERKDCEGIAMRFQRYGNLNSEEMARFRQILTDWWDDVFKNIEKLSWEEFYKTRYAILISPLSQEDKEKHYKQSLSKMFDIIDTNGNGVISVEEWRVYFLSMGIQNQKYADDSFDLVDLNKDGSMSLDEFIEGGYDFMYNQDESPYMHFLGPLEEV